MISKLFKHVRPHIHDKTKCSQQLKKRSTLSSSANCTALSLHPGQSPSCPSKSQSCQETKLSSSKYSARGQGTNRTAPSPSTGCTILSAAELGSCCVLRVTTTRIPLNLQGNQESLSASISEKINPVLLRKLNNGINKDFTQKMSTVYQSTLPIS